MKKVLFLFVLALVCQLSAVQAQDALVPVTGGKVTYQRVGEVMDSKAQIQEKLVDFVNNKLQVNKSKEIILNDLEKGTFVCRVLDFLHIKGSNWYTFDLYVRYQLVIQYENYKYTATIRNISFIEAEENREPYQFSAETAFIDKEYKVLTVKNSLESMADALNKYAEKILSQIDENI